MPVPQQRLGDYRLLERLGQGGMGEVWRARHETLSRDAAIKVIRPEVLTGGNLAATDQVRRRFIREAKATAALTSPHTIRLFDFGTSDDGAFFYAMELLNGLDLDAIAQRFGPLPAERVIHVLRQMCDSLGEAHAAGIIHRDVKPANVFLCRQGMKHDVVKLLDFGLVKPLPLDGEAVTKLTADKLAAGTPAFISPEVALGDRAVDGRTDIYALGCVAYWMLTGDFVFDRKTAMEHVMAHIQDAPEPPSARCETPIPASLDALVLACLAKESDDRPADCGELARMLREVPVESPWDHVIAEDWWATHLPDLNQTPHVDQRSELPAESAETVDPSPEVRMAGPHLKRARQGVLDQLRNHFAFSTIDMTDYEMRVERVQSAETEAALSAVVADLPPIGADGELPEDHPLVNDANALVKVDDQLPALPPEKTKKRYIAIFSGQTRDGVWRVPRENQIIACFGGVNLDLRRAELQDGITEISVAAFFGGAEITVPEDLPVEVDGVGIFGGFERRNLTAPTGDETGPVLRIKGVAFFGGVTVKAKKRKKKNKLLGFLGLDEE